MKDRNEVQEEITHTTEVDDIFAEFSVARENVLLCADFFKFRDGV